MLWGQLCMVSVMIMNKGLLCLATNQTPVLLIAVESWHSMCCDI